MKTYSSLLIALVVLTGFFVMTGCDTMPDPVKDEFLVDQTSAEKQKLDDLAQLIIPKKKEVDKAKDTLKITQQKVMIAKKEIPALEKEGEMLVEKQKLYTIEDNEVLLKKTNDDIIKNQAAVLQQKAYLKYLQALEDDQEALLELKQAELAVYVSEREFEKSKIARTYQEKKYGPEDKNDKGKDGKEEKVYINVETYEKYFTKQKSNLASKTEKQKNTDDLLKKSQKELQDTGYSESK